MKHDFRTQSNRTPPKGARDKSASITYTRISSKDAETTAPAAAAKGDDEVMSTPVERS